MHKLKFEAIGTNWSIETPTELIGEMKQQIHDRIEIFDRTYSRFRKDSNVAQLKKAGRYDFPSDAKKLLGFYRELYDVTDGAVTPLVGRLLEQSGYDASYSLAPRALIDQVPLWDDVMRWDGSNVTIDEPVVLDVGAAGKGYLVDIIATILTSHNINDYSIDASGDVRVAGKHAERIGLENPYDPTRVLGVVNIKNASICASASNRRRWKNWHHIVNAKTGKPVDGVIATWVIADSTMVADGLATALFFVSPKQLSHWDFQALQLFSDGHTEQTENFVAELYI